MGRNDCDECDKNHYDIITNDGQTLCFGCYNKYSGVSEQQREKVTSSDRKGEAANRI